jgi:hypothetical protein
MARSLGPPLISRMLFSPSGSELVSSSSYCPAGSPPPCRKSRLANQLRRKASPLEEMRRPGFESPPGAAHKSHQSAHDTRLAGGDAVRRASDTVASSSSSYGRARSSSRCHPSTRSFMSVAQAWKYYGTALEVFARLPAVARLAGWDSRSAWLD